MSPTMLSAVAEAFRQLGPQDAGRVQMVLVSIDPERDTPESIGKYAAFFDRRFLGLTGSPEQVATAANLFNILYKKHPGSSPTTYLIDHTATLTLVDPQGIIREIFPFGTPGADIAHDLNYWLKAAPQ
jgi:protein SCO1/2